MAERSVISLRALLRDRGGVAAVEFAIAAAMVIVGVFNAIDVGVYSYRRMEVENAAGGLENLLRPKLHVAGEHQLSGVERGDNDGRSQHFARDSDHPVPRLPHGGILLHDVNQYVDGSR
jgi:hypothetical protein